MTTPAGSAWSRWGPTAVLLVVLLAVAGVEGVERMAPARAALQRQYAHRDDFPGNQTLKLLVAQGALHPHSFQRVEPWARGAVRARGRGRSTAGAAAMNLFGLLPEAPERLPSSTVVPAAELDSAVPVLSVAVAPQDLKRLLKYPLHRGREAERTVYVSYFHPGRAVLGFRAGLRLHGGRSRLGAEKKSFRLFLRPIHGVDRLPAAVFFDDAEGAPSTLRRLVIHNDVRTDNFDRDWHLVNPMAYEISRRIGAQAPRTRPARFYLNGELQGAYVLTEHLDAGRFEALFGHRDFVLARTKRDRGATQLRAGEAADHVEFVRWALSALEHPPAELGRRVDLENLFRWYVSILVCGTDDMFQGPLVRDNQGPDRRWFWVNWDMDHSFMSASREPIERRWELNDIHRVLDRRKPRAQLLRAASRSQEHGPRLVEIFTEALNHLATKEYLDDLVDRYEDLAEDLGIADRSYFEPLREFVRNRPAALRRHMSEEIKAASYRVEVEAPAGRGLAIDGFVKTGRYEGWYFENQVVKLDIRDEDRAHFDHWLIDGQRSAPTPALEWTVRADTRIEAVFAR